MENFKAYEIDFGGIIAYYSAKTRGRARYLAAKDIRNADLTKTRGDALMKIKCRRAEWKDHLVEKEGSIIT